jgi:small subunit ribosomal protein S2
MANKIEVKDLLEAGVHLDNMTRKWDPNMAPYMERNGIHIINLYKTAAKKKQMNALKKIAASGRKYYSLLPKNKQKTSLLKKKLQTCLTSLKDGLVEC